MRIVTAEELENWLAMGDVLEADGRGPKVVRLSHNQLLKVFRPRRRLWLARLLPQAQRFKRNAEQLFAGGITVPGVNECLWLDKAQAVSGCIYTPLPGCSLEQIYRRSRSEFDHLVPQFATFIQQLHQRGIYFRSLHLGNVLLLPNGEFGLIDFLDVQFKPAPLTPWLIKRNLAHLHGYLRRNQVDDFPWIALRTAYAQAAQDSTKPRH